MVFVVSSDSFIRCYDENPTKRRKCQFPKVVLNVLTMILITMALIMIMNKLLMILIVTKYDIDICVC